MTAPADVLATRSCRPDGKPHLYYPEEGFGNVYRRVITNDFFARLVRQSNFRTVAEVPLDSYGVVGAGSLIFVELGCEVMVVSDDPEVLDRARALMRFNEVTDVRYECCSFEELPFGDDAFDLTWSFDRLQALPNPAAALAEICRVSKATFVSVPNVHNYGQYPHYVYHRLTGTSCDYVGPRHWMRHGPVAAELRRNGMLVLAEDYIDAPWWPGFPELPNLMRQLLRRPEVTLGDARMYEASPMVVPPEDVPALRRRVERSAFIELGRRWPAWVRRVFAHNLFVIGCKPKYRSSIAL